MTNAFILASAFIFGTCIGSFLNVCISRIPASESLVYPKSRCPQCRHSIPFYYNIPILSYLWLRGKCSHCGQPIPFRYLTVEFLTGIIAVLTLVYFGLTTNALIYYIFLCALIIIIYIDIDHQIIPDSISLPGILIGFLASFFLDDLSYTDSLIGIALGGGILFAIAWGYYLIARKEGMGGGDIKLLAMIGAFIGWPGVCFTIFIASVTGTFVGIILMIFAQKNLKFALPFGPFLAIGAITYLFLGPQLIAWYFYGIFPF